MLTEHILVDISQYIHIFSHVVYLKLIYFYYISIFLKFTIPSQILY